MGVALVVMGCSDDRDLPEREARDNQAAHADDETGEAPAEGPSADPREDSELPVEGEAEVFEGEFDEWLAAHIDCLRQAGWDAEPIPDGRGVSVPSLTFEQRHEFYEARDACNEQTGVLPPPEPLTEAEIRQVYELALETKRCLEDEGYEIDEPPSVERYLESWDTGPWHPYSSVGRVGPDEWWRLNEVCPQPRLD